MNLRFQAFGFPVSYYSDSRKCSDDNYSPYLRFYPTELLSPDTDYRLIISDQVYLADHVRLSKPDTTTFSSEPLGVTTIFPENGATGVAPSCTLLVTFNTPMDTTSVTAAFELREVDGEVVVWRNRLGGKSDSDDVRSCCGAKIGLALSSHHSQNRQTAGGVNLKTRFCVVFCCELGQVSSAAESVLSDYASISELGIRSLVSIQMSMSVYQHASELLHQYFEVILVLCRFELHTSRELLLDRQGETTTLLELPEDIGVSDCQLTLVCQLGLLALDIRTV